MMMILDSGHTLREYMYVPSQERDDESSSTCVSLVDTGYQLTFSFVCGYGTQSTFGKDKNVFY